MKTRSQPPNKDPKVVKAWFMSKADKNMSSDMNQEAHSLFLILQREKADLTDPEVRKTIPWRLACRLRDENVGGWIDFDHSLMASSKYLMMKSLHNTIGY